MKINCNDQLEYPLHLQQLLPELSKGVVLRKRTFLPNHLSRVFALTGQ